MKKLFEIPNDVLLNIKNLDKETIIYRVLPHFFMEIMHLYFRLEVEGAKNIPRSGAAIITPNHSGYSGLDAMLLVHEISTHRKRLARVLTHHFFFLSKVTSIPANKLGFIEATMKNALNEIKKKNLIILFPEGEYGNFKPTTQRYRLQEFKRGFIRMALQTQTPIVPTVVIGAEETHINLSQLSFSKYLRGFILPLPLNVIPLPARWKIRFLDPIHLPYEPEAANDRELVHELAEMVQEEMQQVLNEELARRDTIY